jgi:hypothetical protein
MRRARPRSLKGRSARSFRIPHIRVSPRVVLFDLDQIDAWLAERTVQPAKAGGNPRLHLTFTAPSGTVTPLSPSAHVVHTTERAVKIKDSPM